MATTGIGDTAAQEQRTKGSQASGIGQTLRDATYQKLTDQKTRATETLGSVAGAVRGMTEPLRESGQGSVADYVGKAAEGIDRWADQLRGRDIDDTVRAVHDFARREPALFLGIAFGAGALLARFLKSSTADGHRSYASASSGGRWSTANSGHQSPTSDGLFDRRTPRMNESGVGEATFGNPGTGRSSNETSRVSSEMPSAREVL